MNWKLAAALCLACAVIGWLFHHGVWPGAPESSEKRDSSIVVAPFTLPQPEVKPNPAPTKPRSDLTDKRKIDSLIAAVADKDSLIRHLSETTESTRTFHTSDVNGIDVSGTITNIHKPIERTDSSIVHLNPVLVPMKIVTVERETVTDRMAWEWLIVDAAVFTLIGTLIGRAQ